MGTYTKEQLTAQLNRIKDATAACRTAIINKGIFWTPNDAKLEDLAQYASFICDYPDIRLEYLQADETPSVAQKTNLYYQTDFYPDSSTDIEISYQLTYADSTALDGILIGCTHTTAAGYSFSGDHYIAAPSQTGGNLYVWRYRNNSNIYPSTSGIPDTNKHIIRTHCDGTAQTVYYDGNPTSGTTSATRRTFELPMNIFTDNQNGAGAGYVVKGTRIYYIKIWKSGNLERFYIPVLHWNGTAYVPCFYDKVNDSYIYKSGTGTVVYERTDDLMLDYIYRVTGTTGFHYDTALKIASNISIDVKCTTATTVSGTSVNEGIIVGYRATATYKYGIYAPTSGTTGNPGATVYPGYLIPRTSTTQRLNASEAFTYGDTIIMSATTNSLGNRIFYKNGVVTTSSVSDQSNDTYGNYIGIFGSSTQESFPNFKIYYTALCDSSFNSYSYIPVLHNNIPCFYDLTHNQYIYTQAGREPGYSKLN